MRAFAKAVAAIAAVVYLAGGCWAFFAPESFFENIATYPPFNEHFVHDLGAFQLGIAAGALAALVLSDALAAGLAAVAVGSLAHGISHLVDHDHGGNSYDPWLTGALGVLSLAGFLLALRRKSTVD